MPRCSASASLSTSRVRSSCTTAVMTKITAPENADGRELGARRDAVQLRDRSVGRAAASVETAASRNARSVGSSSASVPTDTISTPPKPLEMPPLA